jgi:hypothetical protein
VTRKNCTEFLDLYFNLIRLLKYKKMILLLDATFQRARKGFGQVVIFSVMNQAAGLHTPVCLSYDKEIRGVL